MDPALTVAPSTGALKTITMLALRGWSRLRGGGYVRTTIGARATGTATRRWKTVRALASVTWTSTESPARAPSGTGSNPPSGTAVVTEATSPTRRTVALLPAGTVPGARDMYATVPPLDRKSTRLNSSH